MSRAVFVRALVDRLTITTRYVNSFPVFRDVPPEHPDYRAIDTAYRAGLVSGAPHGFFRPDEPMTHAEAWQALGPLLTLPRAQVSVPPLSPKDVAALPPSLRQIAEKLHQIAPDLLSAEHPDQLAWQAPLTLAEMDAWLQFSLEQRQTPAQEQADLATLRAGRLRRLAEGSILTITPTTALLPERLSVGQRVVFSLAKPFPLPSGHTLPLDSLVRGEVVGAQPSDNTFLIEFRQIDTPSGNYHFSLFSRLSLHFQPESGQPVFVVPGEQYIIEVTAPHSATTDATTPTIQPQELPAPPSDGHTATMAPQAQAPRDGHQASGR